MAKAIIAFALTIFLLVQSTIAQDKPSIVSSLHRYQANNGGFKLSEGDSTTSVEATSDALFLHALYGLQHKIHTEAALRYVQSLENGDYGYGSNNGLPSDLESVRFALLSYQNLKAPIPNAVNVAGFIQSLFHTDSNLFGNRIGTKGDLKSTANAVQALKLLNIQDGAFLKKITPSLHQNLKKLLKDTAEGSSFSDASLPALSANYYAILVASITGYELQNVAKFVSFIAAHQSKDGGFYADNAKKTTSLEATAHAIASLNLLKNLKDGVSFADKINIESLISYVKRSPSDLRSTAAAHLVAALTEKSLIFASGFEADTRSGLVDDRIVQGAKVRPVLTTSSIVGISNSNLNVQVTVTTASGTKNLKLSFDADRQRYTTSESVDSTNQLGAAKFDYVIRVEVAEIGDFVVHVVDVKQIGYGVTIASQANLAGKDIKEGETIGIGTELKFGFTLHNQTHESFNSGDFDIIFNVLDSSRVSIHSQTINGRDNKEAITFSYALKSAAIPSGELVCLFEVKGKEGVHTTKSVIYNLAMLMIASEISFDGSAKPAQYKLGEVIKVSMVPATYPDLRTVNTFAAKGAEKRSFFMDVSSPAGVIIQSIRGVPDAAKYTFTLNLAPVIENIGTNSISFKYVTANNKEISLSNYDSSLKELIEDATLSFVVDAELHASNFQERPTKGDFFYGNDITYKFQIKDAKSGKVVVAGNSEAANVFLELKHQQTGKDRAIVSTSEPATHYFDAEGKPQGFLIEWNINPNAVSGAGILSIGVRNADGAAIPLYEEKSKEPIQLNVNIGGEIDVNSNIKTISTLETTQTAFLINFDLKCQNRALKDAQLRCVVSRSSFDGQFYELFQVPVATNEAGNYETSWTTAHKASPSGEYKFQFFREVDKSSDKPLFELSTVHQAAPTGQLPVKTEFLVALLLAAAFAGVTFKKSKYT